MAGIGRRTKEVGAVAAVLSCLLSIVLLAAAGSLALASDPGAGLRLIVHPGNDVGSMERELLADAFLKKATRWPDGEAIEPVDQRFGSPIREHFSQHVLRRSAAAIRSYWQQRIFTGRGVPPPELESDAAVLRYVQTHRGGVGYVSESAVITAVNVITVH
jgi:ABC-type phosphate transport system substrate-binding protein